MSYLQKLTKISVVSSSIIADSNFNSFRFMYWIIGSSPVASNPRFYRTKKPSQTGECGNSGGISTRGSRNGNRMIAQESSNWNICILLEGFSLWMLRKLLGRVEHESDIGRSITRFLRYHPINEFEPFFESVGLQPAEYNVFLPRDLMFLSDDSLLLENYNVLCNYGIERNKIGKIYKEATQIFRYDYGVLVSTLKVYEELGLSQASVVKFVVCSPYLLVGGANEGLENIGFESSWVEEQLKDGNSYNWKQILRLLVWFEQMGCSNEKLADLISQHPDFP